MSALSIADWIQLAIAATTAVAAICALASVQCVREYMHLSVEVDKRPASKEENQTWFLVLTAQQISMAYPGNKGWEELLVYGLRSHVPTLKRWRKESGRYDGLFGKAAERLVSKAIKEEESAPE